MKWPKKRGFFLKKDYCDILKKKFYLYVSIGARVLRVGFSGLQKGVYAYFKDDLKDFLTKSEGYQSRLDVCLCSEKESGFYTEKEKALVEKYFKRVDTKYPKNNNVRNNVKGFFDNAGTKEFSAFVTAGMRQDQNCLLNATDRSSFIYDRHKVRGILNIGRNTDAGRQIFEIKNAILITQSLSLLKASGIVLHGCGILSGKESCIFLGLSGAGKSTLASLYGTSRVLSDDVLPVKINGHKSEVFSSPFNQFRVAKIKNRGYKGKAILFLKKDKRTFLEKIDKSKALSRILKHHINYIKLYNDKETKSIFYNMAKIVEALPVYDLHFEQNKKFIDLLKQI